VKNKESKISRMRDNNNGLQKNFTIVLKVISVRDGYRLEMCGTGTKRKTLPGPRSGPGPTLESETI
jgi:hypothetical protein